MADKATTRRPRIEERAVRIAAGDVTLDGDLSLPKNTAGIVVFAHGSGSSRKSPRNRQVAHAIVDAGLGTLLFDLLTADEERADVGTAEFRFNIDLLAGRLAGATDWLLSQKELGRLKIGYFGASTGAAAALVAATKRPKAIAAIVSRGGRPDLAGPALPHVQAPTLLIVGGYDTTVLGMNRDAMAQMRCEVKLQVVPEASHLFEELGKLEEVSTLTIQWFLRYLA